MVPPTSSIPQPPQLPPPYFAQNPAPPHHHHPPPPHDYRPYHPSEPAYQHRPPTLPEPQPHSRNLPPPPPPPPPPAYPQDSHAPRRSPPPHAKHESADGGYQHGPPPLHGADYSSTPVNYHRPLHSDPSSAQAQPPPGPPGDYHRYPPQHHEHPEGYRRPSMEHGAPYSGVPTLAQHLQQGGPPPSAAPPPQMAPPPIDTGYQGYTPPSHHPPPSPWDPQYNSYTYDGPLGANGQVRRKAVRASQACDNCRAKKAKCDEGRPTCGNCEQNGLECNYRHVPPPKQDRTVLQLTEQVMHLTTQFESFVQEQKHIERTRQGEFQDLKRLIIGVQTPGEGSFLIKQPDSPSGTPSGHAGADRSSFGYGQIGHPQSHAIQRITSQESDAKSSGNVLAARRAIEAKQREKYSEIQKEAHQDMLNGELAIPARHTTAAHDLRNWPGISPFFDNLNVPKRYVTDGEHDHNLDLSQYTTGPFLNNQPHQPSMASPARDGDDASSMSGSSDGRPAAAFVNQHCVEGSKGFKPSPGGRNHNQSLSIDETTAWSLLDSFLNNIHILQPFVNKLEVQAAVHEFVDVYCSEPTNNYPHPAVPRSDSTGPNGFKKRKHAHGSTPDYAEPGRHYATKKPIQRTVENALILLIFALGKICKHPGPLPAPRSVKSRYGFDESLSPMQSTPKFGAATPSVDGRSPLIAHDYTKWEDRRWSQNIDRIPGAAYFAHAASILGENLGGNTNTHVQAHLLAGLYLGQLVHVYDSWKWINTACTAWLMVFKQHDENPELLSDSEKLTYWACLICESDILAELQLIPSGLSRWEDKIQYPMAMPIDEDDEELRTHYFAQISIRQLLNRAQSALYNTNKREGRQKGGWASLNSSQLAEQLENWRNALPSGLRWDEEDPAAETINGARLRGKYYGARNIIFRPFLHRAVSGRAPEELANDSRTEEEQFKSDTQIMDNAIQCIRACHKSTTAFDNVPGMKKRLIVTNIFGTAHAQFGNMLVLGAASKAGPTGPSCQPRELLALLKRTIEFLGYLAPLSPTMNMNVKILEAMETDFRNISYPNSAHQSFNS